MPAVQVPQRCAYVTTLKERLKYWQQVHERLQAQLAPLLLGDQLQYGGKQEAAVRLSQALEIAERNESHIQRELAVLADAPSASTRMQYRYVVVDLTGETKDLSQKDSEEHPHHLSELLKAGWRPVRESPTGGSNPHSRPVALILLEKELPT